MTFLRRSSGALVALALLVCPGAAAAQDGQATLPQPTFRGRAEGVRVDVYVTRDGTPVTDLRREEIELLEDGAAQRIDSFERFTRASSGSAPRVEPRTLERSRELAADPRTRLFVVFLDRHHVTYAPHDQIRLGLFRALEERLGPDDLIALMTPDMEPEGLSFARGVEGLALIEGSWRTSVLNPDPDRMRDPDERLYETCYPVFAGDPGPAPQMIARLRERKTFDALEALVRHLGGVREERSAVLVLTDGWRLYTPNPRMVEDRHTDPRTLAPPIGGRGRLPVDAISSEGAITLSPAMRAKCEADRMALAQLDHSGRVDEISSAASRNNVSVYPVSPAGLSTAPSRPGAFVARTQLAVQADLRALGEDTGGWAVVNTNEIERGITRLFEETSAFYLLGYTSTNTRLDGSYRRITVRVTRPGVRVQARPGYFAATPAELLPVSSSAPAGVNAVGAALAALAAFDTRASLHVRASAWSGAGASGVWLVGDIAAETRRAGASGPRVAEVTMIASGSGPTLSERVELSGARNSFAIRLPAGDGSLPPGEYRVRVRVGAGGTMGDSQNVLVVIPSGPMPIGDPILSRRGLAASSPYTRSADPRFRRNERLRVEWPVSGAGTSSARLLDRRGSAMQVPVLVTERPDDAAALTWLQVDATLTPLVPGDYVIEVTHGDAVRTAAFRVVP